MKQQNQFCVVLSQEFVVSGASVASVVSFFIFCEFISLCEKMESIDIAYHFYCIGNMERGKKVGNIVLFVVNFMVQNNHTHISFAVSYEGTMKCS